MNDGNISRAIQHSWLTRKALSWTLPIAFREQNSSHFETILFHLENTKAIAIVHEELAVERFGKYTGYHFGGRTSLNFRSSTFHLLFLEILANWYILRMIHTSLTPSYSPLIILEDSGRLICSEFELFHHSVRKITSFILSDSAMYSASVDRALKLFCVLQATDIPKSSIRPLVVDLRSLRSPPQSASLDPKMKFSSLPSIR